jgi:hypothetical protein
VADPLSSYPDALRRAYERAVETYVGQPGVSAVDIGWAHDGGTDPAALVVRVHRDPALAASWTAEVQRLPTSLDGVDIVPIDAAYVRHCAQAQLSQGSGSRFGRIRPLRAGTSIAGAGLPAGTLGLIVFRDGVPHALSNAHVLAVGDGGAAVGRDVLQPAALATDDPALATIGRTVDLVRDRRGDAAIAQLQAGVPFCRAQWMSAAVVIGRGELPRCGDDLVKSGIGTNLTCGRIDGIGVYDAGDGPPFVGMRIAPRLDDHSTRPISDFGDSGAAWFREGDGAGVGLHVSGSRPGLGQRYAVACLLSNVLDTLHVTLSPPADGAPGEVVCPSLA